MMLVNLAIAAPCQQEIVNFLNNPSRENYLALAKKNRPRVTDKCWIELKKEPDNLLTLYECSKKGNQWCVDLLVKYLSTLDGGELEDAYIALGESIDSNPTILLEIHRNSQITTDQFQQALIALPLNYVDNKNGALLALKHRENSIASIKSNRLNYQKKSASEFLENQISHITNKWQ